PEACQFAHLFKWPPKNRRLWTGQALPKHERKALQSSGCHEMVSRSRASVWCIFLRARWI
ncbi:hypothetical protein T265_15181, partial [Opisthorchis viverrini]